MSTVIVEGLGASIGFASPSFTSNLITLSMPERAREAIDTTHLGSVATKTSQPGKLFDPGQVSAEFEFDPAAAELIKGAPTTVTVTLPDDAGTIAFTGYVVSEGGEEFSVDTRVTTQVTIQVTSDYDFTPGAGS